MPGKIISGSVIKLCLERRGENSKLNYLSPGRVELIYEMPLAEVIYDFYASFQIHHPGIWVL